MIQEREITLSSAIRVIWERGKRIIQLTVLAMVIGLIATFLIPNRYESTTQMVVKASSIGTHTIDNTALPYELHWNIFPSPRMLNEIMETYELDKSPYDFDHYKDLRKRIEIEEERDQPVFTISVTLEDATMAAQVANRLATEAIRVTKELHEKEIERSYERLQNQLQIVDMEMENYQKKYLNDLVNNKLPLLQAKLETKNTLLATHRQELTNLDISINELQSRKAGFEELFSATDFTKFLYTRRSVIDDAVLMEEIRNKMRKNEMPNDLEQVSNLNLVNQELNGSYLTLDMEFRKLKIDLPTMIERREEVLRRIDRLEEEIPEMQEQIFNMQVEEQIAKQNFDRSVEVLGGIDKQVGWVGTTVNTERVDVYQVDRAIPDSKKVFPIRTIMVGIIGMIAFLISFIYYLLMDLYGLVAERKLQPENSEKA